MVAILVRLTPVAVATSVLAFVLKKGFKWLSYNFNVTLQLSTIKTQTGLPMSSRTRICKNVVQKSRVGYCLITRISIQYHQKYKLTLVDTDCIDKMNIYRPPSFQTSTY